MMTTFIKGDRVLATEFYLQDTQTSKESHTGVVAEFVRNWGEFRVLLTTNQVRHGNWFRADKLDLISRKAVRRGQK